MVDNNKNKAVWGSTGATGRPVAPKRATPIVPQAKTKRQAVNRSLPNVAPKVIAKHIPRKPVSRKQESNKPAISRALRLSASNGNATKFLRELGSREGVSSSDLIMTSRSTIDESYKTTIGALGTQILNSDASAIFSTVLATTSISSNGNISSTSGSLTTTAAALGNDGTLTAVAGNFSGALSSSSFSSTAVSADSIVGLSLDINGQAQADSLLVLGPAVVTGVLTGDEVTANSLSSATGAFGTVSSTGAANLNSVVGTVSVESPSITGGVVRGLTEVRGLNIICDNTITTDRFDATGSSFADELTINDVTINNSFYALLLEGENANIADTVTCVNLNATNIRANGYTGSGDIGAGSVECTNLTTNNIVGLTPSASLTLAMVNATTSLSAASATIMGSLLSGAITSEGHLQADTTLDVVGQLSAGSIDNVANMTNIGVINATTVNADALHSGINITSPAATIGAIGCADITASDAIVGSSVTAANIVGTTNVNGATFTAAGNISTTNGNIITTNGDIITSSGALVGGSLSISGDADIANMLDAHGSAHFYSDLTVDGDIIIDDLNVDNLVATASITAQAGDITASQGDINVTLGSVNVPDGTITSKGSSVGVDGISTIAAISGASLAISTDVDITNNLDVHNDVHIYNDLTVDGTFILADSDLVVNSLTAATHMTAQTGDISAILGSVNVASGDINVTLGNITAPNGTLSIDAIGAGSTISAVGTITSSGGDIVVPSGSVVSNAFVGYSHTNKYVTMNASEISVVSDNKIELWSAAGNSLDISPNGNISEPFKGHSYVRLSNFTSPKDVPTAVDMGVIEYDPLNQVDLAANTITVADSGFYKTELSITGITTTTLPVGTSITYNLLVNGVASSSIAIFPIPPDLTYVFAFANITMPMFSGSEYLDAGDVISVTLIVTSESGQSFDVKTRSFISVTKLS